MTQATTKTKQLTLDDVKALLEEPLIGVAATELEMKGESIPERPVILKSSIQIDSIMTVTVVGQIARQLEIKLPKSIVRTGGYPSVHEAIDALAPRILARWEKATTKA